MNGRTKQEIESEPLFFCVLLFPFPLCLCLLSLSLSLSSFDSYGGKLLVVVFALQQNFV